MELTILMPCLNEEKTIAQCIQKANTFMSNRNIDGEVLIVDNSSTDHSAEIAIANGARVILCKKQGYGNALRYGLLKAKGQYIIMGDCDLSYDFEHLDEFIDSLRKGYDFVIGNRMNHSMEKGAMPFSHRYIGVPLLSFLGRLRYHTNIKDFHCGLRGMNTNKINQILFTSEGMEFATEMIDQVVKHQFRIKQIDISLHKDQRNGRSHLRTIPDGLRHLCYLINSRLHD